MTDNKFALGQLRHAYSQLLRGQVKGHAEFARHLMGPAIEEVEKVYAERDSLASQLAESRARESRCRNALGRLLSVAKGWEEEDGKALLDECEAALAATESASGEWEAMREIENYVRERQEEEGGYTTGMMLKRLDAARAGRKP